MKYKIILLILTGLLLFFSCNRNNRTASFPLPDKPVIDLKYSYLTLDTIILDEEGVESSQMGFSGINLYNEYYFVDSRFCWYYTFDLDGKFKKRSLGQGGGPGETTVGTIATCCLLPDTGLFLLGHSIDHYIYDKNFNKKTLFFLQGNPNEGKVSQNWRAYTHQYTNLICRYYDNKLYFNIYSEHPEFNYIEHLGNYLNNCCHIFEVDIAAEKPGKLYAAGLPPVYRKDPYSYVIFSAINYDIDQTGCFYVSYEADSLIYKYDRQYNPVCSFGLAGKDMNIAYEKITNYPDCRKYFRQEHRNKGYYHWIEYVDETGLLFRSYQKGSHTSDDGLQIYSDKTLLADLSVPKGFKIGGYVAPYYYSQAIADIEKELLIVYRFKLE
ncbi:MAG: hypothetical protein LBG92_05480 [Prevotellaceae bacterium]|jgi:hypothetical protein|nr:hypothetical protein [Prevotellaceae bacterium]